MPTRRIQRGPAAGGAPVGFQQGDAFNEIYIDGVTNELVVGSGASGTSSAPLIAVDANNPVVRNMRVRVPIANVNAGATLLPAIAGKKYRLIDCTAIAIGGAVGAVTTVDVLGTQATSSVKLVAYAQANLTRSTVLYPGVTGAAVLADGASFVQNDVNTAITVGITGASATTATNIDFLLSYAIES